VIYENVSRSIISG